MIVRPKGNLGYNVNLYLTKSESDESPFLWKPLASVPVVLSRLLIG